MIDIFKYLMREEDKDAQCAHCHKTAPMQGRTVCQKCAKELESFRNKGKKKEVM